MVLLEEKLKISEDLETKINKLPSGRRWMKGYM